MPSQNMCVCVVGEDSLLTLQAQEEQFKKMDRTVRQPVPMALPFTFALSSHTSHVYSLTCADQ